MDHVMIASTSPTRSDPSTCWGCAAYNSRPWCKMMSGAGVCQKQIQKLQMIVDLLVTSLQYGNEKAAGDAVRILAATMEK